MPLSQKFLELKKNVKKEYLGKLVPKKYQSRYGKRYTKEGVKSLAYAIGKSRGFRT